jgi:CDGSH-type Zn-finger protein
LTEGTTIMDGKESGREELVARFCFLLHRLLERRLVDCERELFTWCLLCGSSDVPHDDEACELKMAKWKPTGLLPLSGDTYIVVQGDVVQKANDHTAEVPDDDEPFICQRCGNESYNPYDILHGYCSACHDFTGNKSGKEEPQ